jgi:hypothetical protein
MQGIKADVFTGLKDQPLGKIHFGDSLQNLPDMLKRSSIKRSEICSCASGHAL